MNDDSARYTRLEGVWSLHVKRKADDGFSFFFGSKTGLCTTTLDKVTMYDGKNREINV